MMMELQTLFAVLVVFLFRIGHGSPIDIESRAAQSCSQEVTCVDPGNDFTSQLLSNISYMFAWQASAYLPVYFESPYTRFANYSSTYTAASYNTEAMSHVFRGRQGCSIAQDHANIDEHVSRYMSKILMHQAFAYMVPAEADSEKGMDDMLCDNIDPRRMQAFLGSMDPVIQACERAGRPIPFVDGVQTPTNIPEGSTYPMEDRYNTDIASYRTAASKLFAYQALAGMQYSAQVINLCYTPGTFDGLNSSRLMLPADVESLVCSKEHKSKLITVDQLVEGMAEHLTEMFAFQVFFASGSETYMEWLCAESEPGWVASLDLYGLNGGFLDPVKVNSYLVERCKTRCRY